VPLVWAAHVSPPSLVRRMVPSSPTAQPFITSSNSTPLRNLLVPLIWAGHVSPPSLVRRIVPPEPTTQPSLVPTNSTAWIFSDPERFFSVHVSPPFLVRNTSPLKPKLPTAQPLFASTNSTPDRESIVPLVCAAHV